MLIIEIDRQEAIKSRSMTNQIQSVALDRLIAHPDNPNKQSLANFGKLIRNIKRSGRYEPLIVRPAPGKPDYFQIINGHHRCNALTKLGYDAADCLIWDIDDEQTDVLLATLNRLGGSDELDRKLRLLRRLNERMPGGELAKLLPQTAKQIERLTTLKRPSAPAKIAAEKFAAAIVFFVDDEQRQQIENALSIAARNRQEKTKAARKAAALTNIAKYFLDNHGQ
jgi:ParB-like chromosome segregation protein Spo0J